METFVPEQADNNERNGILRKRKRADSTFASKQAKGLKMTSDENAAENEKTPNLREPSARGDRIVVSLAEPKYLPDHPLSVFCSLCFVL